MLATVFSLVLSCVVMLLSGCHGYQMYQPFEQQIFHLGQKPHSEHLPKISATDFFDDSSDTNRLEEDSMAPASDELSVLSFPAVSSQVSKRRRGPTLSVVNPLEVLRQQLMLDLAKQRMKANQKQIVANGELLEKIGKRSLVEDTFQP